MSRPLPEPDLDTPLRLHEARDIHFSGQVSVAALTQDIKIGRLKAFKIGNKLFTTGRAVAALKARRDSDVGAIYVIGYGAYVKIGFSRKLWKRLAKIQEYAPEKITVYGKFPGSTRDEILLHKRFYQHRLNGEWFRYDGELKRWIDGGCQ